jgi:uncharacterized protein (DUF1810 family)
MKAKNGNLNRFIEAQKNDYAIALNEIKSGRKRSHWMWYVFPQLKGLGRSETANHYGLAGLEEAKAYFLHPLLGKRLMEISGELLKIQDKTAHSIFGSPDDMKLLSCMTLFEIVAEKHTDVFGKVIEKYFSGKRDPATLRLVSGNG